MSDLPATMTALQDAIARRRLSCREALVAQQARLRRIDRELHCVVQELPLPTDDAPAGPLAGVGLAHKDIFDTDDRRPGLGHDRGRAAPGTRPAAALARLRARGASHLAALAMAEHACGATGDNPRFERCVNPLHPAAAVGGSSSGSAVAVAGAMVYGSLGTDTAGSVRIPAATCGVLGLKTTQGLIPLDGVQPLAPSLDSVGLLARSAADALALLEATAGAGRLRPAAEPSWRIKAWFPESDLHPQVADALARFALDAGVTELSTPWPGHARATQLAEIVLHAEAAHTHRPALLDGTASDAVQAVALPGLAIPPGWHAAALNERAHQLRAFVDAHLREHQLLMLPALPNPVPDWRRVAVGSPDFEARELLALHRYMGFVNYLGLPALVMPVGPDARGLPISVQLVARPFHERRLLAFAAAVQARQFGADGFTPAFLPKG